MTLDLFDSNVPGNNQRARTNANNDKLATVHFRSYTSLFWCDMSKCLLWKRAASLMIPETSPLPFCRFFSASSNRPGRCITTPLPVIQNGISLIQTIRVDIIYFDADHKRQIHLVVLLLWRVKVNMGTDQRVVRWVF